MKKNKLLSIILPAIFTSGNILCGFISIQYICRSNLGNMRFTYAAYFIILAMIFDIMDGRVARLTKGTSNFGAEFDSLADLVSFGAAPAVLVYFKYFSGHEEVSNLGIFISFIYLLCGAIRLARFNLNPTTDYFCGMPIPGGAALISTMVLFDSSLITGQKLDTHIYFLLLFVTLIGIMMVSTVPYPCLKKNKGGKGKVNAAIKPIFSIIIIAGCIISPEKFFFLMAISYAISGPVYSFYQLIKYDFNIEELELEIK